MSEIPVNPETGWRDMTAEQILERERLNRDVTATSIAQRAAAARAELAAAQNGRQS